VPANPWTIDGEEAPDAMPVSVRSRYLAKLTNPREIWRLLTGGQSLPTCQGPGAAPPQRKAAPAGLVAEMQAGLTASTA
jgi:hypothetical protein